MDSDTLSGSLIDRLERFLLDGVGNLSELRDDLAVSIETARFNDNAGVAATLEELHRLLSQSTELDDADVLPLIFALRDSSYESEESDTGVSTPTREVGTPPIGFIQFDLPETDEELFAVGDEGRGLIRDAIRRGNAIYVVEIAVDAKTVDRVSDAIESEYAVVHSVQNTDGNARFLVVSDVEPKPGSLLERIVADEGTDFGLRVRAIASAKVLGSQSIAHSWYAKMPAVTVRPSYESLERIMLLFDELRRGSEKDETTNPGWNALENVLKDATTVELRSVFQSLRKPIEQLGSDLKKRVTVKVGGDTERVPVTYADALREAIFELIVNAIQHGIEPPEERRELGKRETGTIHVFLRHEEEQLAVRVHDDGRGVNKQRLKAAHANNAGGGIDRVRSAIKERFAGDISLRTSERGTTVEIRIPYAAGMYRAVVFQRGGSYFAAPATYVSATRELKKDDRIIDVSDTPFVRVNGQVLRLMEPDSERLYSKERSVAQHAIILHVEDDVVAIAADRLEGELLVTPDNTDTHTVVSKDLGVPIVRIAITR